MDEQVQKVREALQKVIDPELGRNIVEIGMVENIEVKERSVSVTLIPTSPFCPIIIPIAVHAKRAIGELKLFENIDIVVKGHMMEGQVNKMLKETQV